MAEDGGQRDRRRGRLAGHVAGRRPRRLRREFGGFHPYPSGARGYAQQLVLNICFAEAMADEFAACFADATDAELVALGECFAFGNCVPDKELCDTVAAAISAPGTA